jgi:polyisoprenoid-binding protein YceI
MKYSKHFGAHLVVAVAFLPLIAKADGNPWVLDVAHSRIGFEIAHLVFSSVRGRFRGVSGVISIDETNLTRSNVEITIQAASIDTGEAKRDERLRGSDFFDVAKYPVIVFKSTGIASSGGKKYKLSGELSMHGVSKPITLDASMNKPVKDPWGKLVRSVEVAGNLNRSDYGLTWNKALETGGYLVGDEVKLDIQVELKRP